MIMELGQQILPGYICREVKELSDVSFTRFQISFVIRVANQGKYIHTYAKHLRHSKKIVIQKRAKKSESFWEPEIIKYYTRIKIFVLEIIPIVSRAKMMKSNKPRIHVLYIHAIFLIDLSFFAQDTMRIIWRPNIVCLGS
jgi:hypothetical protein